MSILEMDTTLPFEGDDDKRPPMTDARRAAWARDWHRGNARCPHCDNDGAMTTVDQNTSDGTSYTETWSCGRCGGGWRIEFREAAACIIDANDDDSDWTEFRDLEVSDHAAH